ncbi:light-harvesting antenna LH1, beta subunit [Rhodobium gokarnense]|uniref:Light-harvesting complex 1 beta chain n=1 Tax=Rhodobium gokarnense TaxID=364296 RepID=A0ABT3HBL0_9HYPH|nr:light-harvesting antenna LH1, beta subunit [Rhodobium gokarnense]MCW2307770.1 light-harvesting complex 1 beta chain [Rhodobium gokarnense]
MASDNSTLSGFSDSEAQEFHKLFIQGFVIFLVIAIIAHFLAWMWRPWIPGPQGYASLSDVGQAVSTFIPMIS